MNEPSLHDLLQTYSKQNKIPFHMPGHKQRALHCPDLPWHLDITEIAGFDDLHAPAGILRDAQARAARLWGSDGAYFLVNGSTAGILAGIYATVSHGDRVLLTRGHHRAIDHAVELLQLRPVYIDPPKLPGGMFGSVPSEAVTRALAAHPNIRLAVITSPTYEGVLSDIGAISEILHRQNVPLLVDEAHGAHLGLGSHFPPSAVHMGADLVVQSLHKTLPSLTQTAILHRVGARVDHARLQHALDVFQTSSPSYLLLASIDNCVGLMQARGGELLAAWRGRLDGFYREMAGLQRLKLFDVDEHGRQVAAPTKAVYAHDPGKLTILTGGAGLTGAQLMEVLRMEHGIELEMPWPDYAVAMTGLCSTDEDFARLRDAFYAVDKAPFFRYNVCRKQER